MARKPKSTTIEQPAALNHKEVRADLDAADKLSTQLVKIDAHYAVDTYDKRRLVLEARSIIAFTGEALFELGKRLLLLKEHEPHGEYLEALDQIGLHPRAAQRAIQATVRFSPPNASAPTHLAQLGQTKLIELLALDDDDIEELRDGGSVAGLSLDSIERMSSRELRTALRKEKTERQRDKDVHERVLKTKNEKIDDLDKRLTRRDSAPPAVRYEALREELWQTVTEVGHPLLKIEQILTEIREIEEADNIPEGLDLARGQVLAFLVQTILDMRARHGIDVDLEERITPPWQRDLKVVGRA